MKKLLDKTTQAVPDMVLKGMNNIINSNIVEINAEGRRSSYYFYPKLEDFKEFYRKGNRLI